MKLDQYLMEVKLGASPKVNEIFNEALKQVFSNAYINKIEKQLKNTIKLKPVKSKKDFVAYVAGKNIYINMPAFENLDTKKQIDYLLHEFMHILQKSKKLIFKDNFKELNVLGIKLWKIVKKETKNPGKFLTSKDVPSHMINKYEVIAYLMNDSFKWDEISVEGRRQFLNTLKASGLFDISTPFWKKRLP